MLCFVSILCVGVSRQISQMSPVSMFDEVAWTTSFDEKTVDVADWLSENRRRRAKVRDGFDASLKS